MIDILVQSKFVTDLNLSGLDLYVYSVVFGLNNFAREASISDITKYVLCVFPTSTAQDILLSLSHLKVKDLIIKKDNRYLINEGENR